MAKQRRRTLNDMRFNDPRSFVAMPQAGKSNDTSKSRARTYEGEENGINVTSWLNGQGERNSPASRTRIEGLLANLREVLAIISKLPSDFDWDNAGYGDHEPIPEPFERSTLELAKRLQEYPTRPFFWVDVGHQWYIEDGVWGKRPAGESVAAHSIIRLARAGLLDRLNRCDCGSWFFGRFRHQRSCSASCRRNLYEKTESFRANRRKYMRKYYRLKNSGKVK